MYKLSQCLLDPNLGCESKVPLQRFRIRIRYRNVSWLHTDEFPMRFKS